MKRKTIIAILALLLTAPVWAQSKKSPVSFNAYEWDFGTINAAAGAVCHTFILQNTSKAPVTIGKFVSTCDCIQAIYPTEAIMPGEKA